MPPEPENHRPDPRFVADVRQAVLTNANPLVVVAGRGRGRRPPDQPSRRAQPLAMLRFGSGRPVVLLHGLAASHRFWLPVADKLRLDHDVFIPDLLGFGLSPRPPGGYGPDDHAAAVA